MLHIFNFHSEWKINLTSTSGKYVFSTSLQRDFAYWVDSIFLTLNCASDEFFSL